MNSYIKRSFFVLIGGMIMANAMQARATKITISEDPVSPRADYNLLLFRNLRLDVKGLFGITYDDNINSSENNEEEAVYVTPRLKLAIDWPITPHIKIGTGLDIGYRYYLSGDGNDNFYAGLSGDLYTGVKADIRLGNGVLRVYDNYERQDDTIEIGGRVQDDDYVLNRNTLGTHYRVPLNPHWNLKLSYDYRNTWTNKDTFEIHDNERHRFNAVTSWVVSPQLELGPYYEYMLTDYDLERNNDRETQEVGLSFLYRTGGAIYIDGHIGYQFMDVESGPLPFVDDETDGLTGRLALNYASSEFTNHVLSVTHDRDQDILNPFVNYAEETRYMYAIASEVMPGLTLRGNVALLDIDESDFGEKAHLWQVGAGTSYQLDAANQIRFDYSFTDKDSDVNGRDFSRNRFTVTLVHDF